MHRMVDGVSMRAELRRMLRGFAVKAWHSSLYQV